MADGYSEMFFEDGKSNSLTIKEQIIKYFAHFPLIIISLVVCVGLAILYTRYTPPKYRATTLLLIKATQSSSSEDLISKALTGKTKNNLENETQLIKSTSLMERVVAKNEFNIAYYYVGKVLKTDLYKQAPFKLIVQSIRDSNSTFTFSLSNLNTDGGVIEYGVQKEAKKLSFKWNHPFIFNGKAFILVSRNQVFKDEDKYTVLWRPISQTAEEISGKLGVSKLGEETNILTLSILAENLQQGKDILDGIIKEYNLADIEDRNILTQNTIRFVDDRLNIVARELGGVEGNLENFQGRNDLIDVETQSSQSFANSNDVSKTLQELNVQQRVTQMLLGYFNNPSTQDKLVPSTMGLNDPTLSSLINHYNELQLRKQKEALFETKNSLATKDVNNQINDVKGSILESLQNITRNFRLQENNLQRQNSRYRDFLSSLPRKERMMQEIKRKQSITEGLYLYLLQKREETAITSTSSNVSNYRQIDPAKGYGPVEPNTRNILIYSTILGFLLPLGFIYLKDLLNDKISTRDDISKKLTLPILGEISHVSKERIQQGISVMGRDIVGEQFRILRTNLSFLLKKNDSQVILITSSISGEGKSFVSMNLAAVLAIPGKRVALLEFDLRRPALVKNFAMEENIKGITNYLIGETEELSEISLVLGDIPTLHLFPSGPVSVDAGDLLITERIGRLINVLKQEFDYIVIDSAPSGLVSDAFVLGEFSDAVIYVVRQRYTLKKQLNFLNDNVVSKKLENVALILNDVKSGGMYGYYGYGYGYGSKNTYYSNEGITGKAKLWKKKEKPVKLR